MPIPGLTSLCVIGVRKHEGSKDRNKEDFEQIMAYISTLLKDYKPQIQDSQRTVNLINEKYI